MLGIEASEVRALRKQNKQLQSGAGGEVAR